MRPVIGITCAHNQEEDWFYVRNYYVRGILEAGGQPILLPAAENEELVPQYLGLIDGLLLSGGGDIDPVYWGEAPQPGLGEVSPVRDAFELALTRLALAGDLPILGICRGIQVIAVAAGGALYQDLADERPDIIQHWQKAPRSYPIHPVQLKEDSWLARIFGEEQLRVNSFHHQAVRDIPAGFMATATAPDGVIEGMEANRPGFVVGVQWHPEAMWEKHPRFLRLFSEFVEAARLRRAKHI